MKENTDTILGRKMFLLTVTFLSWARISVSAWEGASVTESPTHPSMIPYDLKDKCHGGKISLTASGRGSGGLLKLLKTDTFLENHSSCLTVLHAPQNRRILVSLNRIDMRDYDSNSTCVNYIQFFKGAKSDNEELSYRTCGLLHSEKFGKFYTSERGVNISIYVHRGKTDRISSMYGMMFDISFNTFTDDLGTCVGKERYRCRNGFCIWEYFRCNGYNNCGDESDENECGPNNPDPDAAKPRRGTNNGGIIGIVCAILMLLLILIFLMIPGRKNTGRFVWSNSFRRRERRRRRRCDRQRRNRPDAVATIATSSDCPQSGTPYVYDNDGYTMERPPTYEEAVTAQPIRTPLQRSDGHNAPTYEEAVTAQPIRIPLQRSDGHNAPTNEETIAVQPIRIPLQRSDGVSDSPSSRSPSDPNLSQRDNGIPSSPPISVSSTLLSDVTLESSNV